MRTLSISEARNKIFKIADEVQIPNNYYMLTENGRSKVAILSAEEFDSMLETLEVIKDFPQLHKDIKKSVLEYRQDEFTTLDKMLSEKGYTYAISNNNPKKRPKKLKKS